MCEQYEHFMESLTTGAASLYIVVVNCHGHLVGWTTTKNEKRWCKMKRKGYFCHTVSDRETERR